MKPNLTYPVPAATPASGNMSNERDPMRAHPLAELVIRDGLLIHAMPAYPAIEYLTTPPIEIMGKNGLVELPGGEVAFLFRLNHFSDSTWEDLCSAELKGVKAEIQGAQLELRCAAADLGRNYTAAKAALERANRGYAKLRAAFASASPNAPPKAPACRVRRNSAPKSSATNSKNLSSSGSNCFKPVPIPVVP